MQRAQRRSVTSVFPKISLCKTLSLCLSLSALEEDEKWLMKLRQNLCYTNLIKRKNADRNNQNQNQGRGKREKLLISFKFAAICSRRKIVDGKPGLENEFVRSLRCDLLRDFWHVFIGYCFSSPIPYIGTGRNILPLCKLLNKPWLKINVFYCTRYIDILFVVCYKFKMAAGGNIYLFRT